MDSSDAMQLIVLIVLLALSAFFSSAETALTCVSKIRIRSLAEEGNKRACLVKELTDNPSKMLSAILIGNNIVNLTASSLATTFAIRINLTVGIATGILTVVILILGEIVPKNMAMVYSERLALFYAGIISGLMKLMTPVIFAVDLLANGIMKVLHIDRNLHTAMTENELRTYVEVSHEDGVIESEEREMIYNLFDFSDAVAKDIMIPRIDMASISEDAGYDEVMALFKECMYTRIPVYREDKDNIIGLINIKDFILVTDKESFQIGDILREAYYTYEYKKTADLMMEMREKRVNVSFVLNEYGATVGMITLEDLIEEIVGEIRDEYDEDEEELIRKVGEREYLVEGSMKLDDINDQLGTELMSEDYDSIGGLLIENLDRLPEDGETITLENGITLQVKGINQNRIINVLMTLPEESGEEETDENKDLSSKDKTSEENAS